MAGKKPDKIIYRKLQKIQDDINLGNRIQKRFFLLALAGSFIILANSYFPFILQKFNLDTTNFYIQNFSGFIGIAIFLTVFALLWTRKNETTRVKIKEEDKSPIIESLFTLSISLLSLALLNKSLETSSDISGLSKTITSGWYYVAYLGIIIFILGLYVKLPKHKVQEWIIKNILYSPIIIVIKLISWAIVLVLFGQDLIKLIQSDWSVVLGLICILVGLTVLISGFFYAIVTGIILMKQKNTV